MSLASHLSPSPPITAVYQVTCSPGEGHHPKAVELRSTSWLPGLNLRGAERYHGAEAPSSQMRFPQHRTLPLVMRFPEDRAVSSPLAEAPSDQGVISGLHQAGNKSAGPVLPSRAWTPLDTKVSLPWSPIHPAPPFPDPRNQVQGAHPQDDPVPASSYGAAVPSPIQAKERVEGRGRNAQFPSPGSDPLVLHARAPGGQFRGGSEEQSCRHQRKPVSPALPAS